MAATLLVWRRIHHRDGLFSEIVIWRLPRRLPGSDHELKYRLALIDDNVCVLRYDNESGKGDHRHLGQQEGPYAFTTVEQLLADFEEDVRRYANEHADHRQPDR